MGHVIAGYTHHHVTERELAHTTPCGPDGPGWEDCTWCAAIMFWRARGHPLTPATLTEAEALLCAAGNDPNQGANQGDVLRGIRARYLAVLPAPVTGTTAILDALTPGTVASVQGSMGAFPSGSHWRRWDPAFAGPHCATVFRPDATDAVWWDDPLAPEGIGYDGEAMQLVDLHRYVDELPGAAALVAAIVPDPVAVAHELYIAAGVRTLYLAKLTAAQPPKISGWDEFAWSGRASSAGCDAQQYLEGTIHGGATVARITRAERKLQGRMARVGRQWGVTVEP